MKKIMIPYFDVVCLLCLFFVSFDDSGCVVEW
jgi:hypothetical protein